MSIEITSNGIDASTGASLQRIGLAEGVHEGTMQIDLDVDIATQTIAEANRIAEAWSSAGRDTGPSEILCAIAEGLRAGSVRRWCQIQSTQPDEELTKPSTPTGEEEEAEPIVEPAEEARTESTEFPTSGREV